MINKIRVHNQIPVDPSRGPVIEVVDDIHRVRLTPRPVAQPHSRAITAFARQEKFSGVDGMGGIQVIVQIERRLVRAVPVEGGPG